MNRIQKPPGKRSGATLALTLVVALFATPVAAQTTRSDLCMDGFCIGQKITVHRFDEVHWLTPTKILDRSGCNQQRCLPNVEFSGYAPAVQSALARMPTVDLNFKIDPLVVAESLSALRSYRYDCTAPLRRVVGFFYSSPSNYITTVGLRLFPDGLRIYRISRIYPYRDQQELISLARQAKSQYGDSLVYYQYLSSNAYSDVQQQLKNGWFARSSMFNPTDSTANTAELVLIDPSTRQLLVSSTDLNAGEIADDPSLAIHPSACSRDLSLQ